MLPATKLAVGVNVAVAIAELLMLAVALCRVVDSVVVSGVGLCEGIWLGPIVGLGIGSLVGDTVGAKLVGDKGGADKGLSVGDDVELTNAVDISVVTTVLITIRDNDGVVKIVLVTMILDVAPVVVWDVITVTVSVNEAVVVALVVTLELPGDVCELVMVEVAVVVVVIDGVNNVDEDVAKLVRDIGAVMRPDEVADVAVCVAIEASVCVLLSVEIKMICLAGVRFDVAVPDDIVDVGDVMSDIVVSESVTGGTSDVVGLDEPVEMADVV